MTSGNIIYSIDNLAEINLTGGGIVVPKIVFGDAETDSWNPDHACFSDCTPGKTISLSQAERFGAGLNPPAVGADGFLVTNNITYEIDSLDFQITAGNVVIRPRRDFSNATAPFVFRGAMSGISDQGVRGTFDFIGSGQAGVGFQFSTWTGTTYRFESAAPTPEPGTWWLLGTAVALGIAFRRTYARRSGPDDLLA